LKCRQFISQIFDSCLFVSIRGQKFQISLARFSALGFGLKFGRRGSARPAGADCPIPPSGSAVAFFRVFRVFRGKKTSSLPGLHLRPSGLRLYFRPFLCVPCVLSWQIYYNGESAPLNYNPIPGYEYQWTGDQPAN
jgi:hypothetical protein